MLRWQVGTLRPGSAHSLRSAGIAGHKHRGEHKGPHPFPDAMLVPGMFGAAVWRSYRFPRLPPPTPGDTNSEHMGAAPAAADSAARCWPCSSRGNCAFPPPAAGAAVKAASPGPTCFEANSDKASIQANMQRKGHLNIAGH